MRDIPVGVEKLRVPENQITSLAHVGRLTKLRVLNVSQNPITSLAGVRFPLSMKSGYFASTGIQDLRGVLFGDNVE